MKEKCLVCAILAATCILLPLAGCQEQAKSAKEPGGALREVKGAPEPNGPAPKITFEKIVCDFGEVGPNTDNKGQIKFTNTGEALLKITKVSKCCGVVATLDKMEYAPGEGGAINVQWKSGARPTEFERQLIVHSNDKANPDVTLTIKARIVERVVCEPSRLKLFLDEDNAGCPQITLRSLDERPFSITGFKSTADCIAVDFDPSVEATRFVLQPKVNQEKLQKNLKGRINIDLTHPEGNIVSVLFDVLPKYTITPPLIILFDAQPEMPTTKTISVLNNYNKDFEIESVSSKGGVIGVRVLDQKKISSGYQLDLEILPPPAGDAIRFTDTFTLNLKGGENLPITCNGYFSKKKPVVQTQ